MCSRIDHIWFCRQSVLSSVSWRLADGAMQCQFSRRVKVGPQEPGRFDLDQSYFLFLASGQAEHGEGNVTAT